MVERSGGGGKLHDIKETASDAVEIIRELGTPGVQETFIQIRQVTITAKEIMETMKTDEWQRNIENFRLISDNFNQASERLDKVFAQVKETGVIDEAKALMESAKTKIDGFGTDGQGSISGSDLKEVVVSVKEMVRSISGLVEELKMVAADSRKSGTLRTVQETVEDVREIGRSVQNQMQ